MTPKHPHPHPHPRPRRTDTGPRQRTGREMGPRTGPQMGPGTGRETGPRTGRQTGPGTDREMGPRSRLAARRRALAALTWLAAGSITAGRRVLGVVSGEMGRRLARAAGLTVVLAVVVTALYDRGEVPTAAAQQAVQAQAGGTQGGSAARGGATGPRKDPAKLGGLRGRARLAGVGERPAAVAAAWYAARHGVPRARVKPLQQDRLSATEVRVLVLADHGHGRLRTALVRLRRGADGWSVR
jgi:hypothetical protein